MRGPPLPFLGGLSAGEFLHRHWQKKPLLVRNAMPAFSGLLSPDELAGLATLEGARARLVRRRGRRFTVGEGPFTDADFARLPRRGYSLLVQGVNHHLEQGERLLDHFSFIPRARLDDLMVSYATPGGGVGPHFDSYDVFLLQGMGRRRWQVSAQRDLALVEGAPLRILSAFVPEVEWVVGPGDLLYLPPRLAHHGVALDACMTYSIGFRAPSARELVDRFLQWLPDHVAADPQALYADPHLRPAPHASHIGDAMVAQVTRMLSSIRWDRAMVARFLGEYLSEPRPDVVLRRPARPPARAAFARRLRRCALRLTPSTVLLTRGAELYVNGTTVSTVRPLHPAVLALADHRRIPPGHPMTASVRDLLFGLYCDGCVEFE